MSENKKGGKERVYSVNSFFLQDKNPSLHLAFYIFTFNQTTVKVCPWWWTLGFPEVPYLLEKKVTEDHIKDNTSAVSS